MTASTCGRTAPYPSIGVEVDDNLDGVARGSVAKFNEPVFVAQGKSSAFLRTKMVDRIPQGAMINLSECFDCR